VLVLVHHGDIRATVQAMKTGACDCLETPVESDRLKEIVERLLGSMDSRPPANPLTPMEITVLGHILEGKTSRQIADTLCRSPRTIEVHRSHIMHKLGVSTIVDLIKVVAGMGLLEKPYDGTSNRDEV
jgi:two-component system, LuxR family, response regulator FixJ